MEKIRNPKFELKQIENGQYHFNLIARNGRVILTSETYTSKNGALNGIESVKHNANLYGVTHFDIKESSDSKYYFTMKANNNEIIGTSETYNSLRGCKNGIQSVIKNAKIILER